MADDTELPKPNRFGDPFYKEVIRRMKPPRNPRSFERPPPPSNPPSAAADGPNFFAKWAGHIGWFWGGLSTVAKVMFAIVMAVLGVGGAFFVVANGYADFRKNYYPSEPPTTTVPAPPAALELKKDVSPSLPAAPAKPERKIDAPEQFEVKEAPGKEADAKKPQNLKAGESDRGAAKPLFKRE